jgi:hypothetical protein
MRRLRLLRRLRPARDRAAIVLIGSLAAVAACQPELPAPAVTAGRLSPDAVSCKDEALTDLVQEAHYQAGYLERWNTWDGCTLRLDVITTRHGGCIDGVDDMVLTWPLEVMKKPYVNLRIYTRDPAHKVSDQVPGYLADTQLPGSAVDSGLRQDGRALWLMPGDDMFVWLVSDTGVERWPRGGVPCA